MTNTGTFDQRIRDTVFSFGGSAEYGAQIKKEGITEVLEFIRAHDTGNVSLADMAAVAGATPHHFVSVFTKTTGLSPHQYVLQKRIDRAKAHLQNQRLNIAEVSKLTGFRTHEHFSKVFRRIVGMSPKRFREGIRTRD